MINPNVSPQRTKMHILGPEGIAHLLEDHVDGGGRCGSIVAMVFKHLLDDIHDGDTSRTVIHRYSVNSDDKYRLLRD
ncbi:unnamed protein product [Penicillium camemberti]|uniref:Str. FM013 n=1 Tax=Penicillium camemberti (strain FM 013) TaxID=1429867 RepID=A0A0G4NWA6_PENC3|nr:unnamed protein product [Penicillium camemberti]